MSISKKFKRINKGILLGVLALLALTGYYTAQLFINAAEQHKIKTVLADFTAGIDKALLSPEKAQSFNKPVSDEWIKEKEKSFTELLDKYYAIDVTKNKETLKARLSSVLSFQKSNSLRVLNRKSTVNITSIRFKDEKAYVGLELSVDCSFITAGELSYFYSGKSNAQNAKETSIEDTVYLTEEAVLEKVGATWRIRLFGGNSIGYTGNGYIEDYVAKAA